MCFTHIHKIPYVEHYLLKTRADTVLQLKIYLEQSEKFHASRMLLDCAIIYN